MSHSKMESKDYTTAKMLTIKCDGFKFTLAKSIVENNSSLLKIARSGKSQV